jgi:hypothetical protein
VFGAMLEHFVIAHIMQHTYPNGNSSKQLPELSVTEALLDTDMN